MKYGKDSEAGRKETEGDYEEEAKFPIGINLMFLPTYSSDLNPIEFVWKSTKRGLSPLLIKMLMS